MRRLVVATISTMLCASLLGCASSPAEVSAGAVGHDDTSASSSSPAKAVPDDAWTAMTAFFAGGSVLEVTTYGSLDAIAAESDLVVLARFESVSEPTLASAPDLTEGAPRPSVTVFHVSVLDGSPDLTPGEIVDVEAFGVSLRPSEVPVTTDRALLFLHRREDTGAFRLSASTGLMIDRSGVARLALPEDAEVMNRAGHGEGRPFSDVLADATAVRRRG